MNGVSSKRTTLVLTGVVCFLLLTYVLSMRYTSQRSQVKTVTSALLNPKYKDTVTQIEITDGPSLTLKKVGSLWIGQTDSAGTWPVQKSTIENLITNATNIIKMYTKADNVRSWGTLHVTPESARKLVFMDTDGQIVSELYFGLENALTNRIAVRSGTRQTVYEVEQTIETYLTTDRSFWCDPYLYPQYVTGASDAAVQSVLRRGPLVDVAPQQTAPAQILNQDFENGARVMLRLYPQPGGEQYLVSPRFISSPAASATEKAAIESFSYCYSMSSWTYQKLSKHE